jgi:bifunctional non-homologous end joining protein LigD
MLWRVSSRRVRSRSKPPGFILPCQPAPADRPPAGPGWLHEIKFDGYRVIARKDGDQVRLRARTTSDYSKAFIRIRDAVAGLPIDCVVLDGEAVLLRSDNTSNFDVLRSRQGQAEAILVAYDVMEVDGADMRPEPLEERRKRLARLLSRSNKPMRDGIQLSEAITAMAPRSFGTPAVWGSKASSRSGLARVTRLKTKNPQFSRR